ncbi:MAG: Lrp/AsnC family transcriptional regulator [Spirochaetales bacterium]|nr:Lrp/AsnC family transcriptional regulator [Spirochaetales bacterium]
MYTPDDLDWKIIDILREEDQSNNAVARQLGISEGTVRQRLKRLKEADILTIRAQINPEVLEDQQLAMVGITIQESCYLKERVEEISALPSVLSASITSGRYDIIAEVLSESNHGLVEFLTDQLSGIKGIQSTETFVILKSYKKYV